MCKDLSKSIGIIYLSCALMYHIHTYMEIHELIFIAVNTFISAMGLMTNCYLPSWIRQVCSHGFGMSVLKVSFTFAKS